MKKWLFVLIMLTTVFTFAACDEVLDKKPCAACTDSNGDGRCDVCENPVAKAPCTECTDSNGDEKCDECGKTVQKAEENENIELIVDSDCKFNIVIADGYSSKINKKTDDLIKTLRGLGYTVKKLDDSAQALTGCEVLIGQIKSRGEKYNLDPHYLGAEGHSVKIVDGKIHILGGSDEALITAIDYFIEKGLGITDTTKQLTNATFQKKDEYEKVQSGYTVTSITVADNDIKDYVIAVDRRNGENAKLASSVQKLLYEQSGYWLNIVNITEITDEKHIAIKTQDRSGDLGFWVKIVGDNLEIISEFPNRTQQEGEDYFRQKLLRKEGTVVLDEKEVNVRDIYYEMEQFGAVGDGRTDDSEAIRRAHEYANTYGHTVKAKKGKVYYIGPMSSSIEIRTDVDWSGSEFIIDDRDIAATDKRKDVPVFRVLSDRSGITLSADNRAVDAINSSGGIDAKSCTNLDLGLGYAALLLVYNSTHRNYIRYGPNANEGQEQRELVVVDKDGRIDPKTPFLLDYDTVTKIVAYRIDDTPITLKNATFTTRANQGDADGIYYSRSLSVQRSNTTLTNITHIVTDESEKTNPYGGFFSVTNSNNVTFDSCTLQGLKITTAGTYDTGASYSNNVIWKNCTQSNFFCEDGITPRTDTWGVMGSNYCKNLTYDGCRLSRFDAHAGVYNATVINTEIVHLTIIGGGTMLFENSTIYNRNIMNLRDDYGSTWNGEIIIRNVRVVNSGDITLLMAGWHNHSFGYRTYLPQELTVDGLTLDKPADINLISSSFVDMGDVGSEEYLETKNLNPMAPIKKVTIKNNHENYRYVIPDGSIFHYFKNTEIVLE